HSRIRVAGQFQRCVEEQQRTLAFGGAQLDRGTGGGVDRNGFLVPAAVRDLDYATARELVDGTLDGGLVVRHPNGRRSDFERGGARIGATAQIGGSRFVEGDLRRGGRQIRSHHNASEYRIDGDGAGLRVVRPASG